MVANSLLQETHFPAEGKREEGEEETVAETAEEEEEEIVPPDGGAWVNKFTFF